MTPLCRTSKHRDRNSFMRPSQLSTHLAPWRLVLTLASTVLIFACGGSKDPILGLQDRIALSPSVSATAPLARNPVVTGVAINARVTASFNKAMNPSSLNPQSFTLQCPAGTAINSTVSYETNSRVAALTPAATLPLSTLCQATVTTATQDTNGIALSNDFAWSFETGSASDNKPPTVTQHVPAQNAVAATNTQVTVSFSEDMDPASLNANRLTLTSGPDDTPVTGAVRYAVGARTASFKPDQLLPSNSAFTVTVNTAVTDLAGNPMQVPKVWTFTTSELADTTAPLVTMVNPADTSTGICTNKTVNATFSKPMEPLSITSTTLTLTPSNQLGAAVAAVVTYDALTQIASINPSAKLAAATAYTAVVHGGLTGVKDLAGNALLADKVWRFSTGAGECQSPVALGSASNFAILGSATITNIPTSLITGDVGLTPDTGANITGFSAPLTCPEVVGHIYAVDSSGPSCALVDAVLLSNAKADALAAFINATGAARGTPIPINTNLEGLTFYPGLYESLTTIDLSAGGILTLDAQGDPNAVFVIRSATAINTLSTSQIVLSGGAKAHNVFGQRAALSLWASTRS
jgi:hypothetical protein